MPAKKWSRNKATQRAPSEPLANQKHEKFAQLVITGLSDMVAYQKAFKCRRQAAIKSAYRLREILGIEKRIMFLQEKGATKAVAAVMNVTERREISTGIARDIKNDPSVRLQATVIEAKHAGEFMDRQDLTTNGETIPTAMPTIIFNVPASFNRDRKK